MRYQISIQRHFRARHAIRLPDGSWEPPHSHRWGLGVTVGSPHLDAIETVMDFHELEHIVDEIVAKLIAAPRHDINLAPPFTKKPANGQVPPSPTARRIAEWLGQQINHRLTRGVGVGHVRLEEAPGCFAIFEPGE